MDKSSVDLSGKVGGLTYIQQFISKEQERQLITFILGNEWNTSLKRRTQHYGFTYSYDQNNRLENALPIPGLFGVVKQAIEQCIKQEEGVQYVFDQIIVNEYSSGQGISAHIDNKVLFDSIIVSLSLASDTTMIFQNRKGQKVHKTLARRSLIILNGQSRYHWKHSIPSRKSDKGIPRKTRYSLTFRKTINKKVQQ